MTEINMLEAKTNLTKLVKLLETKQEDEIIICRHGEPCAKIIPFKKKKNERIVGKYDGKCKSLNWNLIDKMEEEILEDIYTNIDEDIF